MRTREQARDTDWPMHVLQGQKDEKTNTIRRTTVAQKQPHQYVGLAQKAEEREEVEGEEEEEEEEDEEDEEERRRKRYSLDGGERVRVSQKFHTRIETCQYPINVNYQLQGESVDGTGLNPTGR